MLAVGFETIISAGEQPQNYALDLAATENGKQFSYIEEIHINSAWTLDYSNQMHILN
jgi:hypothetical protein